MIGSKVELYTDQSAEQDYLLSVYSSSMIGIVHAFLFDGKSDSLCPGFS